MTSGSQDPVKGAPYVIPKPGDWAAQGHCANSPDPDLWHTDDRSQNHQDVALAVSICAGCPVRLECLQYALGIPAAQDWGIWGGLTANQRQRMRTRAAA